MQQEDAPTVIVKFNWQDDLRRETMRAPLSFAVLDASARSAYGLAPQLPLALKYKDQDGDLITVACDRDLEEALKEWPSRLYIYVFASGDENGGRVVPEVPKPSQEPQAPAPPCATAAPLDIPALLQTFGPMLGMAPQLQQGILNNPQLLQLIQSAMQNPALLNFATQFLTAGMPQQPHTTSFPFAAMQQSGKPESGQEPFPFSFASPQHEPVVDEQREAECLQQLQSMGFGNEQLNREILRKQNYDIARAVQELTRAGDD